MVESGKWYRFYDQTHIEIFLQECKNMLTNTVDICKFNKELHAKPIKTSECLKFNLEQVTFNYRTNYNPQYDDIIIKYYLSPFETRMTTVNTDNITIKSPKELTEELEKFNMAYNAKFGGENMNNEMIENLIRTYREKECKRINDTRDNNILSLVESTEIGKAAKAYLAVANRLAQGKSYIILRQFKDLAIGDLFDAETQDSIKDIDDEACIERDKLDEKMNELRALLSIAETYEQKVRLLKKYNIISK